ncbi:MAG: hypothetical protein ABIF11_01000 [Nitrospirota bacterium]
MRYSKLIYYFKDKRQMLKLFTIFFMSGSIIFISSLGITGIPLKKEMTPQEVKTQIEEMQAQREKMAREFGKEQQKKEDELAMREQLIQASQPSTPALVEKKPFVKEKQAEEVGKEVGEEEKAIPAPIGEIGKGLVPGVITPEQESEEAKKIEKREKVEKEYKSQRNFSFILMIIVMLATIGLLIKSMSKGKNSDEKKKK